MRAFMYGAWLAALLLWIAGCGDSTLEGLGGSAGTGGVGGGPGTGGTGGRIGVEPPPTPDPGCNTDDLACEHGDHSSVFAIAHGFYGTSPPTTLVYRVQVDAWTDETSLMHGDGQDNGFYYLVRVNNGKPSSVDSGQRVPFNGFRTSADGSLSLPAFEFTVVVDVSETPLAQTSLEVLACAATNDTSGTGGTGGTGGTSGTGGTTPPPCEAPFWSDTYGVGTVALPLPQLPPTEVSDDFPKLDFGLSQASIDSLSASGVLAHHLVVTIKNPPTTYSDTTYDWIFDHLVFHTSNTGYAGRPFPNDILQDEPLNDDAFVSFGVLPLAQGAACDQGTCWLRYRGAADKNGESTISATTDPTRRDYLVYTRADPKKLTNDPSKPGFTLGVSVLTDVSQSTGCGGDPKQTQCPALLYGGIKDAGPQEILSGVGVPLTVSPTKPSTPLVAAELATVLDSTAKGAAAGDWPTRQVAFSPQEDTCKEVVTPLIQNGLGPNYLISLSQSQLSSDAGIVNWPTASDLGDGLYYLLPKGFGTCEDTTTNMDTSPFCDLSNRGNYVPHYTTGTSSKCELSDGSELNGGSSSAFFVNCATFADQYVVNGDAEAGSLIYFDSCGWSYAYSDGSAGERKAVGQDPAAPSPYELVDLTVTNDHPFPVVFARECCTSYFQAAGTTLTSDSVTSTEFSPNRRPPQMQDTYGTYVRPGQSVTVSTLFPDQTAVVYHGLTGEKLYKLRVYLSTYATKVAGFSVGKTALYDCNNQSASISDSGVITLGSGELNCEPINQACPWGTAEGEDGPFIVCSQARSSLILGTKEWAAQFDPDTPILLQAWGTDGNTPFKENPGCALFGAGGWGGKRGFAATVLKASDFMTPRGYVLLVGRNSQEKDGNKCLQCGGISSTLFSHVGLRAWSDQATAPTALYLLAGGGGSSSRKATLGAIGQGGNGAAVIDGRPGTGTPGKTTQLCIPGGSGTGYKDWAGAGVSTCGPDGAAGGSKAKAGGSGVGGLNKEAACLNWFPMGTAVLGGSAPNFVSSGQGGEPNSELGGRGGSGYGAGGGGYGPGSTPDKPGGGGGAGSYATKATAVLPRWNPGTSLPVSPDTVDTGGPFQIVYAPTDSVPVNTRWSPGVVVLGFTTKPGLRYQLEFQSDGNLVVYKYTTTNGQTTQDSIWSSGTKGQSGDELAFQGDGNLVIYASGTPIFATCTEKGRVNNPEGKTVTQFQLYRDGNVAIVSDDGVILWSTNGDPKHCPVP